MIKPESYSASFLVFFVGPKKKGKVFLIEVVYARFLSSSTITIPTIAIAMIIATTAGTKYASYAEVLL
jgi:hypothetical protein